MAISVTLNTITSGYNVSKINANFTAISAALQDALSRTGVSPNTMSSDIDMNNNDLINVGSIDVDSLTVGGSTFDMSVAAAAAISDQVHADADAAAASAALAATFVPANYLQKTGGTLTGGLIGTTATFSGAVTASGQAVWHAGNLTPANYAPLAGATFTGAVTMSNTLTTTGTLTTNGALNTIGLLTISDPTTNTKKFKFDASGITAANTRTITVPDKNITLKDTAWEIISTVNISGSPSVIDFTNLSAYEFLRVSGYCWTSLDATLVYALFSTDNGATFPTGVSHYFMNYQYVPNSGAVTGAAVGTPLFTLTVGGSGTTNLLQSSFSAEFSGWNKAVATFGRMNAQSHSAGNGYYEFSGGGKWVNGGAVACNALRLLLSAGTFSGGTIRLEGIKG